MKRTFRLFAAPAVAALLLASCGSSEPAPAETEVANAGGEGKSSGEIQAEHVEEEGLDGGADEMFPLTDEPFFASTNTGALITMTMDAQPESDEEIAWLEEYREDAGGGPVSYVLSDVDNRDGSELINMYNISLYDEDGTEYACVPSEDYADENWRPIWLYGSTDKDEYTSADGEPMENEKAEELEDRFFEHETVTGVDPFERASMVSICPADLPEQVVAVEVMPGGIVLDAVYATPESYMGEDG